MTGQFIRYVIVGVLNTAIDFTIFNILSISFNIYSGVYLALFNVVAFAVAFTNSYFCNKYWTFKIFTSDKRSEFLKFFIVNIGALIINTSIVYFLTTHVSPVMEASPIIWENFAKILALFVTIMWNFTGFKFLVFTNTGK